MMQMQIRRIGVLSAAVMGAGIGLLVGLVEGTISYAVAIMGSGALGFVKPGTTNEVASVGLFALIGHPLLGLLSGFLSGGFLALAYNLVARFAGGITVDPEIVVHVSRGNGKPTPRSYEDYLRKALAPEFPTSSEGAVASAAPAEDKLGADAD